MNKDQRFIVSEYVANLSDEDLATITQKLSDRLEGDLAEVLDFFSHDEKMDHLLASTNSSWELYDCCDDIRFMLIKECRKRALLLKV